MNAKVAQNMALARARTRAECSIEAGLVPLQIIDLVRLRAGKAKGERGGQPADITCYPRATVTPWSVGLPVANLTTIRRRVVT